MGKALKKELIRYGLSELASHVVVDTVPYMSYTRPVSAYNAISKVWPGKISKHIYISLKFLKHINLFETLKIFLFVQFADVVQI